jgi:hypothetical protein
LLQTEAPDHVITSARPGKLGELRKKPRRL